MKSLALVAQKAEHNYVGTRCAIMDQLTVTVAQKSHALLIDCRSLDANHIEMNLPQTAVVICNTNVKHELATSAYNQRRSECEQAVRLLREHLPTIQALRDVSIDDLERQSKELPEIIFRRARHIVTENARTLEGQTRLKRARRNVADDGPSHQSLHDFSEQPGAGFTAEIAGSCHGVFGSRMTEAVLADAPPVW